MRLLKAFTVGLLIVLFATQAPSAFAQLTDILKSIKKAVGMSGGELSESKIIEGLKEALMLFLLNCEMTIHCQNHFQNSTGGLRWERP